MVSNGVGLKLVVDDVLVKCSVAFQSAVHSGNIPGGVVGICVSACPTMPT